MWLRTAYAKHMLFGRSLRPHARSCRNPQWKAFLALWKTHDYSELCAKHPLKTRDFLTHSCRQPKSMHFTSNQWAMCVHQCFITILPFSCCVWHACVRLSHTNKTISWIICSCDSSKILHSRAYFLEDPSKACCTDKPLKAYRTLLSIVLINLQRLANTANLALKGLLH